MYPLHRVPVGVVVLMLGMIGAGGCQQARINMMTGPSVVESSAGGQISASPDDIWTSPDDVWGAVPTLGRSADTEDGFTCALGPFGTATDSHATLSESGNETVVCSGEAAPGVVRPDRAFTLEGFACALHFGDGDPTTRDITTNSRVLFAPSGQVTLVCQT